MVEAGAEHVVQLERVLVDEREPSLVFWFQWELVALQRSLRQRPPRM